MEKAPFLELKNISCRFPSFRLDDISFSVNEGDYFILLGMSGAGKSMILEMIAGLVPPDSGTIRLDGQDIMRQKIQDRQVGLVFQDLAIFPHLSVAENIGYSLKGRARAQERQERIQQAASRLNIPDLLDRRPETLSGGELQRVALARSLVHQPKILLLDEPLSSLDSSLKAELRKQLRQLNRQGQTLIHVTHDYEEAISLGNRIAVIHEGRIIQQGSPSDVFFTPRSEFVAHFTGARNFFKVTARGNPGEVIIQEGIRFKLATDAEGGEGYVLLRSEDVFLSRTPVDTSAMNNFDGKIIEIVPSKNGFEVHVDIGIPLYSVITRESLEHLKLREGESCYLHFKASAVRFIKS